MIYDFKFMIYDFKFMIYDFKFMIYDFKFMIYDFLSQGNDFFKFLILTERLLQIYDFSTGLKSSTPSVRLTASHL